MGKPNINVAVGGPINADYPKIYGTRFLKPAVPFGLQVTETATKYIVKHDFDLNGESVTIPENCILEFDGGNLANGTLVGNNTQIIAPKITIFNGIIIDGTWNVPEITSAWFSDAEANNGLKNVFALQSADVHNRIVIEKGNYIVSAIQEKNMVLQCLSNLDLIINGDITLLPNSYEAVNILSIFDEEHITVSGSGTIIGDKETHTGTTGEWGHGIYVSGSFVTIKDIAVKSCWGDCIVIGRTKSQTIEVNNVIVENCYLNNGKRQGISITHGSNIVVRNCRISNVGGTNPQAGIDIEPNENCYADNIVVDNCRVEDCQLGIVIYGRGKYTKSCITISNCYIKCARRAFAINGISTAIKVTNCEVYTRFHAVDANTIDGSQDNVILFENNMITQQPEEGDDVSTDARGCAIYALKGDYCFKHNTITCTMPVFRFGSGNKYVENNDIVCPKLFYEYRVNGVKISGNNINGDVNIPGTNTILERNTINGFLKSYSIAGENSHNNGTVIRSNYIKHPTVDNDIVQLYDHVIIEGNDFTNVKLKLEEGVVTNNTFVYNANFTLTNIILDLGYADFINNTVKYSGTNAEDTNVYLIRSGKSIVGNDISAASRMQYLLYAIDGCFISGNKLTLSEQQEVNHIVRQSDTITIIPAVRTIGTSAQRPEFPIGEYYYIGCRYFDIDLGTNIYWNGINWIDAFGTLVNNLYGLKYILENVSASNYRPPMAGEQFTTVLKANDGYSLPATIKIDMNNVRLTAGTDYTYNQVTGEIVILGTSGTGGVTGNIAIKVIAV